MNKLKHISEIYQDDPRFIPLPIHEVMLRYLAYRDQCGGFAVQIEGTNSIIDLDVGRAKIKGLSLSEIYDITELYRSLRDFRWLTVSVGPCMAEA